MSRIRLLGEQTANKIAAGEVVERPASVFKELVENALDAGASRIEIDVVNGGKSLLRVSDDGEGMDRDDALLCLERHATSKIREESDIERIITLGFRGEALPSIAAVSKMEILTRPQQQDAGTKVVIHGGRLLKVEEAGAAPGTVIEVKHLFFNLPARRKFLRTPATELGHIQHLFQLHALSNHQVAWKLTVDRQPSAMLAPAPAIEDRIRELHGRDYLDQLVPLQVSQGGLQIRGFVGRPGFTRANRREQYFFVNGRPIESKALHYALLEGFHTSLMKGRYPVALLFVTVPPDEVDVNIHPAKREIRFRDEWMVRDAVARAVRIALGGASFVPQPSRTSPTEAPDSPPASVHPPQPEPTVEPDGGQADVNRQGQLIPTREMTGFQRGTFQRTSPQPDSWQESQKTPFEAPSKSNPVSGAGSAHSVAPAETTPGAFSGPGDQPKPLDGAQIRIMGVLSDLYVLLEGPDGLLVMDQHAAHERVLFEQFLRQMRSEDSSPSQMLLVPQTVELEIRDAAFLTENLDTLRALGVGVSPFGARTFVVESLPPALSRRDPEQVLRDIVDELQKGGSGIRPQRLSEERVASAACKHAVKAEDTLSRQELERLVRDLLASDLPYSCPHGRPTMIRISFTELERRFGRRPGAV
jgi:DNA mismatch repair protein MutL